jgi:hypothetical protein
VSENVIISVELDASSAQASMDSMLILIDEVTRKAAQARQKVMQEVRMVSGYIRGIIGLFKSVIHAFGVVLTPAQEAILNLIVTAVSSMVMIAAAFTSTGIGVIAGAMFAAAALGLSIGATARALEGIESARGKIDDIMGVLSSLESLTMIGRHY